MRNLLKHLFKLGPDGIWALRTWNRLEGVGAWGIIAQDSQLFKASRPITSCPQSGSSRAKGSIYLFSLLQLNCTLNFN